MSDVHVLVRHSVLPIFAVGVQSLSEKLRPVTETRPEDVEGLLLGTIPDRYAVTSKVKASILVEIVASVKR